MPRNIWNIKELIKCLLIEWMDKWMDGFCIHTFTVSNYTVLFFFSGTPPRVLAKNHRFQDPKSREVGPGNLYGIVEQCFPNLFSLKSCQRLWEKIVFRFPPQTTKFAIAREGPWGAAPWNKSLKCLLGNTAPEQ